VASAPQAIPKLGSAVSYLQVLWLMPALGTHCTCSPGAHMRDGHAVQESWNTCHIRKDKIKPAYVLTIFCFEYK